MSATDAFEGVSIPLRAIAELAVRIASLAVGGSIGHQLGPRRHIRHLRRRPPDRGPIPVAPGHPGLVTTWLAEGQSPVLVQRAMGHADLATTMGYTHHVDEGVPALVERPGDDELRQLAEGA